VKEVLGVFIGEEEEEVTGPFVILFDYKFRDYKLIEQAYTRKQRKGDHGTLVETESPLIDLSIHSFHTNNLELLSQLC
jgi:hypothetical protein